MQNTSKRIKTVTFKTFSVTFTRVLGRFALIPKPILVRSLDSKGRPASKTGKTSRSSYIAYIPPIPVEVTQNMI